MPNDISRESVHTIIFSDTHVGSPLFHAKALRAALSRYDAEQIIANGDFFDDSNLKRGRNSKEGRRLGETDVRPHRIPRSHLNLLEDVNDRAKDGCNNIWITGNHDDDLGRVFAYFLGAQVAEEYSWEYKGKRFLAIHGDQFDIFFHKYRNLSAFAARMYHLIQKSGSFGRRVCAILKSRSKRYIRALDFVANGAIGYAAENNMRHVFCGHTHHAEHRSGNGVEYYNSGCWTSEPCSFITIGEKGIRIHYFNGEGEEIRIGGPFPI